MLISLKYVVPSVESVRLQLEGIIATSNCPKVNGKVWYEEYETENVGIPVGQEVMIF